MLRWVTGSYWYRLARQVFKECTSWSTDQIMPLLFALAGAWATVHFGLVPTNQTEAAYVVYVLPFAVVFAVYVVYQVVRAPYVLDKEHRARIAELERERDSVAGKPITESAPQQLNPAIAAIPHTLQRVLWALVIVGFSCFVMLAALQMENIYDQFPNPLSSTQMSALVNQLRDDPGGPQRVEIVRKEDPQSVELAEQFRQIFESAHWVLVSPPRPPTHGVILLRGLTIWHAPTDVQAFAFSRVLHDSGVPYQVFADIELTNAGYFELTISDGWINPPPPRQ